MNSERFGGIYWRNLSGRRDAQLESYKGSQQRIDLHIRFTEQAVAGGELNISIINHGSPEEARERNSG